LIRQVPWWGKIAAKLVLARLPFGYSVWQKFGIFRHGQMDTGAYALTIFRMHAAYAQLEGRLQGKTVLELGPGDGIASAMLAAAHGARAILLDTGAYVRADMAGVRTLAAQLRAAGLNLPDVENCRDLDAVFAACGARYLTRGLTSLRELPDASVDWIFSQSVLEHVRRRDFAATLAECRRVLAPGGAFTNHVDLKDHLGGALNNLRFSHRVWESEFFARSGFYTNRIRYAEMLALFRAAGFEVAWTTTVEWQVLPTPRGRLDGQFRSLPEDDLKVSGFDVLLR
jgi:SAM-dependent methyltransferase